MDQDNGSIEQSIDDTVTSEAADTAAQVADAIASSAMAEVGATIEHVAETVNQLEDEFSWRAKLENQITEINQRNEALATENQTLVASQVNSAIEGLRAEMMTAYQSLQERLMPPPLVTTEEPAPAPTSTEGSPPTSTPPPDAGADGPVAAAVEAVADQLEPPTRRKLRPSRFL